MEKTKGRYSWRTKRLKWKAAFKRYLTADTAHPILQLIAESSFSFSRVFRQIFPRFSEKSSVLWFHLYVVTYFTKYVYFWTIIHSPVSIFWFLRKISQSCSIVFDYTAFHNSAMKIFEHYSCFNRRNFCVVKIFWDRLLRIRSAVKFHKRNVRKWKNCLN